MERLSADRRGNSDPNYGIEPDEFSNFFLVFIFLRITDVLITGGKPRRLAATSIDEIWRFIARVNRT